MSTTDLAELVAANRTRLARTVADDCRGSRDDHRDHNAVDSRSR
jgi:hypothetical protein